MASAPTRETGTPAHETVEAQFHRLAEEWQRAVAHHSSTTIRDKHPAYREIIAIGQEVIPILLRDLEDTHRHWFCALEEITGADPIPEAAAGNIPKMVAAWLAWAKEHGYKW